MRVIENSFWLQGPCSGNVQAHVLRVRSKRLVASQLDPLVSIVGVFEVVQDYLVNLEGVRTRVDFCIGNASNLLCLMSLVNQVATSHSELKMNGT